MHPKALLEACAELVGQALKFDHPADAVVSRYFREQRKRLQEEFKTLLVRTYAGALTQIQDETVVVRPVRLSPGDTEVVVRTEIRGRGDPIQLDYRLEKTPGEGAGWKIFNLNVLGVWLVETYRSQFAQEINARGLDGLVNALAERNRTAGSRPRN